MGKSKGKFKKQIKSAKKSATIGTVSLKGIKTKWYGKDDLIKHYVRTNYWLKRVKDLKRDLSNIENFGGFRYFSLCSEEAIDVRLLLKNNLLDTINKNPAFVFCEYEEKVYKFLNEVFIKSRNGRGFLGLLSSIATDISNEKYGEFWGTFPFNVINLDYFGDIFRAGNFANNDFRTIQEMVNRQSMLRKPYELWITLRVKDGRMDEQITFAFRELINDNIKNNNGFEKNYSRIFPGTQDASDLSDEELYIIGYLKWLLYINKQSYSRINIRKTQILKYKRIDKDGKEYYIYNFLLRIQPYETIIIPTPCCDAAKHSEIEYRKGVQKCILEPIDIDDEFKSLEESFIKKLEEDLKSIHENYIEDSGGYLNV